MTKLHNVLNKAFKQASHSVLDMVWLYCIHGITYSVFLYGLIHVSIAVSNAMQLTPLVSLVGLVVLFGLLLCIPPIKKITKSIISFSLTIIESIIGGVFFVGIFVVFLLAILLPIELFIRLLSQSGML